MTADKRHHPPTKQLATKHSDKSGRRSHSGVKQLPPLHKPGLTTPTVLMATHADHLEERLKRKEKKRKNAFERNLRTKRQSTQSHQLCGVAACQCYCGLPNRSVGSSVSSDDFCASSRNLRTPQATTLQARASLPNHGTLGSCLRISESPTSTQLAHQRTVTGACFACLSFGMVKDTQQSLTSRTHSSHTLAQ